MRRGMQGGLGQVVRLAALDGLLVERPSVVASARRSGARGLLLPLDHDVVEEDRVQARFALTAEA